jgi:DNA-binding NarL/FixJ family response regulator
MTSSPETMRSRNDTSQSLISNGIKPWVVIRGDILKKLRVLIGDNHEDACWVIKSLLCQEYEIVGSVTDGKQLIDAALANLPNVIVSEMRMPLVPALDAMKQLRSNGRDIPFVLIGRNSNCASECILAGAMAFVDKLDMGYDLVLAIRSASSGQTYFSRSVPHVGASSLPS